MGTAPQGRSGGQVVLDGVTKRFGDVVAVDDITLTVEDQEFLVLLGPSGCGKSTALRMIAGLDVPSEGSVSIGGEDVTDLEPRDRDVSMVFQSYALYPHMTVRRNIEFPLKNRKVPKAERAAAVAETSATLGLDELLDRKPAQLSGGQRQRVALARAIVRRPSVFLMDEPLSNLDAKLRVQTRAELIELQRRLRTTTIYVTHDQVEAMTMGDRIAIVEKGALQQVAAPAEVYARPANLFVAGFIGNPPMNLLAGRLVGGDAGALGVEVAGVTVPLTDALSEQARASGATQVVLGVRPESVVVDPQGDLTVDVMVVESLGHERHLVCRSAGEEIVTVRVAGDSTPPEDGDSLRVRLDRDALHLFDAESGLRIGP